MNETPVSAATPPVGETAAVATSDWTAGRIAMVVIGALLVLLSLGLLGAGGAALWADRTQRDRGYATTDVHEFSTSGAALTTEPTHLGSAGVGWLYSPGVLGKVRIRVMPSSSASRLFVGIAPSAEVDRYLAGAGRTLISDFFEDEVDVIGGGPARSAPGTRDFWVASSAGRGTRTLVWDPTDGSWTVVVMNADGRPGISVKADLGARVPALPWIAVGLLIAGALSLAGGVLLTLTVIRRRGAGRTNEGRSDAEH